MSNLTVIKPKINETVVNLLKKLLARAEKGEIIDLALVYKDNEQYFNHYYSSTDNSVERIGAVTRLLHKLNLQMDRSQEDEN